METAYGLKEKILVASLIRDMGKAIENKKTDAVSAEQKNSAWERVTTQYKNPNQRVPQYARPSN
jgi:hypothetical protein